MSLPRRSARLSPHLNHEQAQHQSTTSYSRNQHTQSQPSSTSTTSQPSPVNDGTNPPPSTPYLPTPRLQVQPSFIPQQAQFHGPLPSPSAGDVNPFFGRAPQPNPYLSHPAMEGVQSNNTQGQQPGQTQEQHHHPHLHQNSISQPGGAPQITVQQSSPGHMPPGFLAEAAKRAQMACLMRDLGDVSL